MRSKKASYGRSSRYGMRLLHPFAAESLTQRRQFVRNRRNCVEFTIPLSARSGSIDRIRWGTLKPCLCNSWRRTMTRNVPSSFFVRASLLRFLSFLNIALTPFSQRFMFSMYQTTLAECKLKSPSLLLQILFHPLLSAPLRRKESTAPNPVLSSDARR